MPRTHRAPFPKCKCEFELLRAQMQKLHQWSEFNDSPVFECVDNGHRPQHAAAIRSPDHPTFPAETTRAEGPHVGTSWVVRVQGDDERWTGGDGCTPSRSVHMTACIETPVRCVIGRLRSPGRTEQASAGQLMPRERVCGACLHG